MRITAIAVRILQQMRHDKRTLAMMLMAPLLVLTLIYFILTDTEIEGKVAIISAPQNYVDALADYNIVALHYTEAEAEYLLERGEVDALIKITDGKSYIKIDGSDSQRAKVVMNGLEMAKMNSTLNRPDLKSDVFYVYGYEDMATFDNIGNVMVGILIFFFVFLVAGISFLQERTSGTLEKLLSTPVQRWEIVCGYVAGFGVLTIVQSIFISSYVVFVLGAMMVGSFFLVLVITFCTAMMALTLGLLLSTAADNEFQMVQFIPLVVVPQVFFSGLFQLSPLWSIVGKFMPLHYTVDALKKVMLKDFGLFDIFSNIAIMIGLSLIFMFANTFLLKRYRKI